MNAQEYKRTQKVLDTLNEISKTQADKQRRKETFSREEMLRLLEQLNDNLNAMFFAGDFNAKEKGK